MEGDAPGCASEFAEVQDGHRMVMGWGSEECWELTSNWNGQFDYKARELMKKYVDSGIPIVNPCEIYKAGGFGAGRTTCHFNNS